MKQRPHVLVIGPSESLGGIASVIRMHRSMPLWKRENCRILSTYDESSARSKVTAALKAYACAPFLMRRAALVHVHMAAQKSILRKTPIILLAKLMRKPYILHIHAAGEESLFQQTPPWLVRLLFLLSYRVVVLSEKWADAVRSNVTGARVTVIHNPVALPSAPPERRSGQPPVILFGGKLEHRKGFLDFLDAAARVLKQYSNAQIRMAGNGDLEQARSHAKTLGIQDSVTLLGWLQPEQMAAQLQEATVFCLPSYNEGLPMAVLEAMGHALPVVVTPVGGLPDLISDGVNGLFAQPGDAEGLAARLLQVLNDPELAQSLGQEAAKTISERCGMESIELQINKLYDEVKIEASNRRQGFRESVLEQVAEVSSKSH